MNTLNSTVYQYRDFESTYLLKVKNETEISLKILDLSQRCFFKKVFSAAEISLAQISPMLAKGNFSPILEKLAERELLLKKYLIPNMQIPTKKTCEGVLEQTIDQFKPKVFVEGKELERFTCPITLEIFQEPVIDEHGHTYEKSAIESHLQATNASPINRQPIYSLTPNRLVKDTIEEWQKEDPIPSFSLFQKENPKLVKTNLTLAQTYIEEKEYQEALDCYTKVCKYSRNEEDYIPLISLFEIMGQYEKATLAYLYLARYQLSAGKTLKAIGTLEKCQVAKSFSLPNNLILIELYYYTNQSQKALSLSIETAKVFSQQNPKQAIALYKRILRDHPGKLSLYLNLGALLGSTQEKVQTFLKGALEAFRQEDYTLAEKFIQEAESYNKGSFIDDIVLLDLIKKQEQIPRFKQKLFSLAEAYEKKGLTKQLLSTYKMLFQIERNSKYCQKILYCYQKLQKPQKEFEWSLIAVNLLIEHRQWEQAERLAKQALQKALRAEQRVMLYTTLETVYSQWKGHELQDLLPKLGKAYEESSQLALAEKTYRKAFERFHRFQDAIALAELLKQSDKTQESVHTYYEAAVEAILDQNSDQLSLCTREIKQIDPHMQQLDLNQRMHLSTQQWILSISEELRETREENALLQQKMASLENFLEPIKEKTLEENRIKLEKLMEAQREMKMRQELSQSLFDKAKWEKYFGDVGIEPPLPKGIKGTFDLLKSPCPFWKGKRIEETHILVLIPKTLNGSPLTVNALKNCGTNPKEGAYKTKFSSSSFKWASPYGNKLVDRSYWALMTKDVVPGSLGRPYHRQGNLLRGYSVPKGLEIAIGSLIHHAETGIHLYPDNYTYCEEIYKYYNGSFFEEYSMVGCSKGHYLGGGSATMDRTNHSGNPQFNVQFFKHGMGAVRKL